MINGFIDIENDEILEGPPPRNLVLYLGMLDYGTMQYHLPFFTHEGFEHCLAKWCVECYGDTTKSFLDLGANVGLYSVILAKHFKKGYAFEPVRKTFANLCVSISANRITNVETHNLAIGNVEGIVKTRIGVGKDFAGSSTILEELREICNQRNFFDYEEDILITNLDSFDHVTDCAFIKMDVEGSEADVLRGGKSFIRRNNYPPILFESWAQETSIPSEKDIRLRLRQDLFETFKELGYNNIQAITGNLEMFIATKTV